MQVTETDNRNGQGRRRVERFHDQNWLASLSLSLFTTRRRNSYKKLAVPLC